MVDKKVDFNKTIDQVLDTYFTIKGLDFIVDLIGKRLRRRTIIEKSRIEAERYYIRTQLLAKCNKYLTENFSNKKGFKCIKRIECDVLNEDDYKTGIYLVCNRGNGKPTYCYKVGEIYFDALSLGLNEEVNKYKKLCKKYYKPKDFHIFIDLSGKVREMGENFKGFETEEEYKEHKMLNKITNQVWGKDVDDMKFKDFK